MKNYEKIKNMGLWELATLFYDVSNGATKISVCEEECKGDCSDSYCISQIGEWLISEEENEDGRSTESV